MDRSEVLGVYDDRSFAAGYNERFLLAPWPKHGADFEAQVLRGLLGEEDRWLDLGCGTGYFLSLFPDIERAGLDLSPAMLAEAREANPSALFLREGDFCHDIAEWHAAWDLVSCMWMAYCYLASMPEVEQLVTNMVNWTAPGGTAFIPSVIDLEDLRPHTKVAYEEYPDVWGGRIALTGFNWTWEEPNGDENRNMMAVHAGHFVRLLEEHFTKVEVLRYPLFMPGFVSRKAVLATGRREPGETGSAEIVWHPIPSHPDDDAAEETTGGDGSAASTSTGADGDRNSDHVEAELAALRSEVNHFHENWPVIPDIPDPGTGPWADHISAEVQALRSEVDNFHQHWPPEPQSPQPLTGVSTRQLAAELARRLRRPGPLQRRRSKR